MFNLFRSQKQMVRIFLGAILLAVAFSMVITLIPGLLSTPPAPGQTVLAEVSGYDISAEELGLRLRVLGVRPTLPLRTLNLTSAQYINDLITDLVLLQEAEELGLTPNEQELAEWVEFQLPFLFPDGVFVGPQQYAAYVRESYRRSVREFEAELRHRWTIDVRLQRLVTSSEWVSNEELQQAYRNRHNTAKIEFVKVTRDDVRRRVRPTEEKLKAYYEERRPTYLIHENRTVKLLTIKDDVLPVPEISDAETRQYYAQHRVNYELPERVSVRHILFMTMEKRDEEVAQIEEKAKKTLEEIRGGADFAKLATALSEDPAAAADGGNLGWITRGEMDPEFEKGAFTLQPGEISDLVKSPFGFHIIKADNREPGGTRPFDEVQDQIRESVKQEQLHLSRIQLLDEVMAAARVADTDLDEVGGQYNLPVQTLGPFTLAEAPPEIATPREFLNEVFVADVGEPLSSTTQDSVRIVVLTEINRPRIGEYEEVKDDVREQFIDGEARALAAERAFEIAAKAREGNASLRRVASRYGLKTEISPFFKIIEPVKNLGPASFLGRTPFESEPGPLIGPVPVEEAFAVYRVVEQQEADLTLFEDEKEGIRETLLQLKRNDAFNIYKDALVERYEGEGKVVRYPERVQEFARSFSRRGG